LDEVVSTLDIETAYEIEKLVLDLDTTVIMVSNAFSGKLIEKYDAIILMDNGQIISSGSHKELLEKSKMYRKIYEIRCGTGIKEAK
jgi:ATP-binding cassette subfamily C protein